MRHALWRIALDDEYFLYAVLAQVCLHGQFLIEVDIHGPYMRHGCRIVLPCNACPFPAADVEPQEVRDIDYSH